MIYLTHAPISCWQVSFKLVSSYFKCIKISALKTRQKYLERFCVFEVFDIMSYFKAHGWRLMVDR